MSASTPAHDIADRGDIAELVTEFYTRAFRDELLGHVFVDIARLDLATHLPIMCDFWETVLLGTRSYRRSAFTSHLDLHRREPLTARHFQRWIAIWSVTVDERFSGPVADAAKAHAARVSTAFQGRFATHDARGATSS